MQDRVMTDALTTDQHFQQAGFRALLLARIIHESQTRPWDSLHNVL
jgi:hypothetical protein